MKFDRTKYTAHYENGVVVAQWISVEASIDSSMGESPLDALDKSQELVQQWYKSKNLPFDINPIPPGPSSIIQVKPEDREIGVTVEHIMSCDDLKTLDTYKFLVKGKGKEHLQDAFNTRENQIIQRMTKE